ncbi:MAG: NADH-quinone oxidoreductase subunit N [Thermomicrobiales bacterium]|nr:NADH-quinone oxidoreductase subunit N [Thermomicrobiales bacterium]
MLVDLSNLPSPDWLLALPQLIVLGLAIVLLLADAFVPARNHYTLLTTLSIVGYAAAMASLWFVDGKNATTFWWLFRADGLSVFLCLAILLAALLTIFVSASYVDRLEGRMPIGEYYVLLALSTLGALLVAAAGDLVVIFIGIELSSLAVYVLTAFAKRRATAVEGAMKYFLLGIFASAILVYGMAWIYGQTGSTNLDFIAQALASADAGGSLTEPSLLLALLLLVVGLGFKMAAVPFHFWTPDAYDGAPTPVTAFMSVVPKAAAFAATIRILVQALGPMQGEWLNLIAVLALLTMALGNIVAISQRNVKRMLAYSSIAHTGYIMVGLAAYRTETGFIGAGSGDQGVAAVLYYLFAYAVMNVGAFGLVAWLQHRGRGMTLDDFSGLASSQPLAAAAMTVFMLSLMGIPPTIGFYAKYRVIVAAIDSGTVGLALSIGIVVLSAVSAFYYLRVVAVMYFNEPIHLPRKTSTPLLNVGLAAMAIGSLLGGVFFAGDVFALAERWYRALTVLAQVGIGG